MTTNIELEMDFFDYMDLVQKFWGKLEKKYFVIPTFGTTENDNAGLRTPHFIAISKISRITIGADTISYTNKVIQKALSLDPEYVKYAINEMDEEEKHFLSGKEYVDNLKLSEEEIIAIILLKEIQGLSNFSMKTGFSTMETMSIYLVSLAEQPNITILIKGRKVGITKNLV